MAKLLLITHDDVLARAYRIHLGRSGFEVEQATTGHEGLLKARQWIPDVIVLDLLLPGMHGLDVLKWLRDVPWLVMVHVVLLIERTVTRGVLEECLLWGAGSYVYKDGVTPQELLEHLYRVLAARSSAVRPLPEPTSSA